MKVPGPALRISGLHYSPQPLGGLRAVCRACCAGILLLAAGIVLAGESEKSALWREAEKTLGVQVLLPATSVLPALSRSDIAFTPLGPAESNAAVEYLRLYIEEFSKYPRSLLRSVNLEWVAFVKGLKVSNQPRGATYLRFFADVTLKPAGGMVYDVQHGARHEAYVRWVLHHEFFHFMDDHLNRSLEDRAWAALNPASFRYSGRQASYAEVLDHPQPGMITTYSLKSVWEDRAEIFAALFVDAAHERLAEIAAKDPAVRRKIRRMMTILRGMDPALDRRYFQRRLGAQWSAIMGTTPPSR